MQDNGYENLTLGPPTVFFLQFEPRGGGGHFDPGSFNPIKSLNNKI